MQRWRENCNDAIFRVVSTVFSLARHKYKMLTNTNGVGDKM